MSTILYANTQLTLVEVAKRTAGGKMLPVAEILSRNKPVLQHAPWTEANETFSNVTTRRYSLPAGSWRKLNAGVATESSQTTQVRDQIGLLETYADNDVLLVDSMPNPSQFRNDENSAFLEGLSQTWASQLWYGNALVDPEKWTGLAPRMAALNVYNVQGCSGTGSDVSSIYLVQWGLDKVYMVYPRGSSVGLEHRDLGEVTKINITTGAMFQVYRDWFKFHGGLVVKDPRCIGRVANMETSGSTNIFDEEVLIKVKNNMFMQGSGAIGYCSKAIYSQIEIAISNKSNVFHSIDNPFGPGKVPALMGIPIYVDEMIVNTETAIS